ncbi:MAG: hypothetical protein J6A90_05735 [Clostridia bacterium]|nr:hypothetical protein [Clostridia bacterium]
MEWYNYVGIASGVFSLFFGFCAFFLYMKIKKLVSLLSEEEMKEATPIINDQVKKVKISLIACVILGVVAVVMLII